VSTEAVIPLGQHPNSEEKQAAVSSLVLDSLYVEQLEPSLSILDVFPPGQHPNLELKQAVDRVILLSKTLEGTHEAHSELYVQLVEL
jgi:hypothetical protein